MSDLISREAAIERATRDHDFYKGATTPADMARRDELLNVMCWLGELPPAQPERERGRWTTEEVAELLFNLFGDDCACNFFGIDEWLPERCKYAEIAEECPSPKEKHGCWMQFLIQGGADMRGEQE